MNNPAISVLMCARNAEHTIVPAIQSILWQTKSDFEFLILDDGSTDKTLKAIHEVPDTRIQIFSHPQSLGLARGLNFLLDKAKAPLIARMDADDLSYPDRFEQQCNFLAVHPDIDLLASSVLVFGKGLKPLCRFPVISEHEEMIKRREHGFFMPHPTWMGKREWFMRFRYNESFSRSQDQDLLQRSYLNSRFHCLPTPTLAYSQADMTLKRRLLGRFNLLKAVTRQQGLKALPFSVLIQTFKGFIDTCLIGFGQGDWLLSRWGQPLTADELAQFQTVCRELGLK